jgi:hypothetical protein
VSTIEGDINQVDFLKENVVGIPLCLSMWDEITIQVIFAGNCGIQHIAFIVGDLFLFRFLLWLTHNIWICVFGLCLIKPEKFREQTSH